MTRRQRAVSRYVRRWRRRHPDLYALYNKRNNYAQKLRQAGLAADVALQLAKEMYPSGG